MRPPNSEISAGFFRTESLANCGIFSKHGYFSKQTTQTYEFALGLIPGSAKYVSASSIWKKKFKVAIPTERWNISFGLLVNLSDINKTQWNICFTSNLGKCCTTTYAFAKMHWCKNSHTTIFFLFWEIMFAVMSHFF